MAAQTLLKQLENTMELPPKKRTEALSELSDRQSVGQIFNLLKSGRSNRVILRCLLDLCKTAGDIIGRNMDIDRDFTASLLLDEDPKARKNAAELIGRLRPDAYADELKSALEREETYFVRPSIILALGNCKPSKGIRAYLSAYEVPACDERQAEDQRAAIKKALSALTVTSVKTPLPYGEKAPLLLFCPNTRVTVEECCDAGLSASEYKYLKNCVMVEGPKTGVEKLLTYHFSGVLAADSKKPDFPAVKSALLALFAPDGSPLPYRIEVKGDMYKDDRKKLAELYSEALDSDGRLINSPSSYAATLYLFVGKVATVAVVSPSFDDRFSWRKATVSASIHPAVAASVIYSARAYLSPEASVLDCFCGSGTMLFARSRFPYGSLLGTDISRDALTAARTNEKSAKAGAVFRNKSAVTAFEESFDEIICNMPFGLRVGTHTANEELYAKFMGSLPGLLKPGGTAMLFTHEKTLLSDLIPKNMRLMMKVTFAAGGLYPSLFVLKRR